jgi:hypothetical protein
VSHSDFDFSFGDSNLPYRGNTPSINVDRQDDPLSQFKAQRVTRIASAKIVMREWNTGSFKFGAFF